MSKFKVGDVCVGQNLKIDTHHLGVECLIVEALQQTQWGDCYLVRWADEDHDRFALPYTLKLKRPPTWDSWIYDTSDIRPEIGVEA